MFRLPSSIEKKQINVFHIKIDPNQQAPPPFSPCAAEPYEIVCSVIAAFMALNVVTESEEEHKTVVRLL